MQLLAGVFASLSLYHLNAAAFNPYQYDRKTAQCPALRRGVEPSEVEINLKYVELNPTASTTLMMVHGWPSLWSTWSNQIEEFEADYHLFIPDLRGFGESTHPGNADTSGTMADLVGDLVCVLEHAKIASTICMGHDWGSSLCYEAARQRPDIFTAVIGVVVPYIPADGPFLPANELGSLLETLRYQSFFNSNSEVAAKELSIDIRRTVRAVLRTVDSPPPAAFLKSNESFLQAWDHVKEIPPIPFFSPEEEDYFVSQYELQDITSTLQFYSNENRLQAWKLANEQGNHTIVQPVLAIYPTQDPVADFSSLAKMLKSADYIPNLTTETMAGAHWLHVEFPAVFNRIVRDWLDAVMYERRKVDDEL